MSKTEITNSGLTPLQEKLLKIQSELKAPKNRFNAFGKYNYRDAEGILEAAKPLLKEHGLVLTLSDEPEQRGDRYYITATCLLELGADFKKVKASAREEDSKKGMDGSQVTGASSSYARKYALNGLFLIDDTQDADSTNSQTEPVKTKEKKQETKEQSSLTEILVETPAFAKAAKWIAEFDGATLDAIDALKSKYSMTAEVETALAKAAAKIREEK